ncbi:uncharacterized protein LOC129005751 isoform X3 [Macrosteles quadrilineatus]|uniref:uncharacterized protein LOC129005751 isoform X3 n=1 Tax=Macrosteles quadrilineatus TaxID=74068 RepID=UPI0023E32134|nr:uncharacterized protein LOC129005751 isoform X3 [Macrosteles quadrilineatus]
MASLNVSDVNPLPPGWDCKYDNVSGKRYYINYFTRHTSMEDPRVQHTENIPLQDFTSAANHRLGLMMGTNSLKRQQSAASDNKQAATDQTVAKISSMFPTVSETHIRTLLLKYHNREAVVMSALQVEKHPLTTPGPYTPPMGARTLPGVGLYAVTPPSTPRAGFLPPRLSPRPHSSPKMKLRYLKSVFPVVEETVLLDTLSSSDNNVHRATQTLQSMGFDKRATPPPRVCLQKQTPSTQSAPPAPQHSPPARMKSVEEKQEMKVRLREKHPDVAERVVSIALDSVDYDETKADQILTMADETPPATEDKKNPDSSSGHEVMKEIIVEEPSQPPSPESPPDSPSGKRNKNNRNSRSIDMTDFSGYRSLLTRPALGPNPRLVRGPDQSLLLVSHRPDYVAWCGSGGLARGPDPLHCEGPSSPRGPDPSLRKGPRAGLARGSIYSQLAALSLAESRGK